MALFNFFKKKITTEFFENEIMKLKQAPQEDWLNERLVPAEKLINLLCRQINPIIIKTPSWEQNRRYFTLRIDFDGERYLFSKTSIYNRIEGVEKAIYFQIEKLIIDKDKNEKKSVVLLADDDSAKPMGLSELICDPAWLEIRNFVAKKKYGI